MGGGGPTEKTILSMMIKNLPPEEVSTVMGYMRQAVKDTYFEKWLTCGGFRWPIDSASATKKVRDEGVWCCRACILHVPGGGSPHPKNRTRPLGRLRLQRENTRHKFSDLCIKMHPCLYEHPLVPQSGGDAPGEGVPSEGGGASAAVRAPSPGASLSLLSGQRHASDSMIGRPEQREGASQRSRLGEPRVVGVPDRGICEERRCPFDERSEDAKATGDYRWEIFLALVQLVLCVCSCTVHYLALRGCSVGGGLYVVVAATFVSCERGVLLEKNPLPRDERCWELLGKSGYSRTWNSFGEGHCRSQADPRIPLSMDRTRCNPFSRSIGFDEI